jgi:hypothetical protein
MRVVSSRDDLTPILKAWPWESGRFGVRSLTGLDGRLLIQVRLELGVIQMEADGRPDGTASGGYGSALDCVRARLAAGGSIDADDASLLEGEVLLFRQRSMACAMLELWPRVRRDALHNLECLELLRRHAAEEEDRARCEAWRPSEIKMQVRAEAAMALAQGRKGDALHSIDRGLSEMARAYDRAGGPDAFERSIEAQYLRGLRESLTLKLPASQRFELERRLRDAIRRENFELAAILRDELRLLGPPS